MKLWCQHHIITWYITILPYITIYHIYSHPQLKQCLTFRHIFVPLPAFWGNLSQNPLGKTIVPIWLLSKPVKTHWFWASLPILCSKQLKKVWKVQKKYHCPAPAPANFFWNNYQSLSDQGLVKMAGYRTEALSKADLMDHNRSHQGLWLVGLHTGHTGQVRPTD